ncbi:MAG: hypothetical protein K6G85_07060 [Eubacterium sp.]|nr:hypothetical protein [Eubacterium sp.]
MKLEEYKSIYEKMETSKEMDQRILDSVQNNEKTRKISFVKVASVAAVFALVVGVYQIPAVNGAVNDFISGFTSKFTVNNETVEMAGDYKTISQKAAKQNQKFDTLADVEKELGISLLKSKDAYEDEKNLISYNPHLTGKGELYGVLLMDDFYAVGDLKNVDTEVFEEWDVNNGIQFESGAKYQTPIAAEITVRGNKNTDQSDDGEVNYKGYKEKFDGVSQVYELKKIHTKAIITTIKNSGMPVEWEDQVGETGDMTEAVIVYEGVEYHYYGVVSQDTMKEFLESLSY